VPEGEGVPEGVCVRVGVLEGVPELVGVLEGVLEGETSAMTRMSKPQLEIRFWQRTWRKYQAPFCPKP